MKIMSSTYIPTSNILVKTICILKHAIENGMYVPSTVLALKIADTLGCSVEDLFRLPSN